MLGSVQAKAGPIQWSVLVLDRVTTSIMSNMAGISDILDYGISLVENVNVRREPLPHLNGIYFLTPNETSVRNLIRDWSATGGKPQYGAAYVFFSSPLNPSLLELVRGCAPLIAHLKALQELNLEYAMVDKRTFSLCEDETLPALFANGVDGGDDCRAAIGLLASRLATVFATMKECPSIRYRAALPPGEEYPPGLESRLLASQRLALELSDRLLYWQRVGVVPEKETCDLIITDRGFDPVAPIIHEWTYEAMAHDVLEGTAALKDPNIFIHETHTQGGKLEQREHPLNEKDKLFVELRHQHFAEASLTISNLLDEFRARNGVMQNRREGEELELKAMSKVIQALPQYRDQLTALATHVELASKLNTAIDSRSLVELGKLEQDLVYGDATSKEVVAFLAAHQGLSSSDKVRLLLCYSATHQEKLDPTREAQWIKVARLTPSDMAVIAHLEFLGVPVHKRSSGRSAITFGRRRKRAIRKDREADESEQQYSLTRFTPMLQEILEDAVANKLSADEYPYVQPPTSPSSVPSSVSNSADSTPRSGGGLGAVQAFKSVRTTGSWVKKMGSSSLSGEASKGRRLFAFVLGGITYSEMRCAHKLSAKLGRDVVLGGTGIETPAKFLKHAYALGSTEPPKIGVFEIEGSSKK